MSSKKAKQTSTAPKPPTAKELKKKIKDARKRMFEAQGIAEKAEKELDGHLQELAEKLAPVKVGDFVLIDNGTQGALVESIRTSHGDSYRLGLRLNTSRGKPAKKIDFYGDSHTYVKSKAPTSKEWADHVVKA